MELTVDFEKRFPAGAVVSAQLRLALAPPGVTVLFGPSGSGKTTILRCLAGLETPELGVIRWGEELWSDAAAGIEMAPQQRRIGYLFQDYALFPHLSVEHNIAYGLAALPAAERRRRVGEAVERFGLADLATRLPRSLSGGQQQRVALARAFAPAPRLLLLDEPLAALDAPTRGRLRSELRRLLVASGVPAVVVTHDRNEALALGDSLVVIAGGRVRQAGPVEEVFSRPADSDVAESVGIETVIAARVAGRRDGLVEAVVGAVRIVALDPGDLQEREVLVCIRAEDVLLETEPHRRESARNHFPAVVRGLAAEGPLVRVALHCGFELAALVTRPACEELQLAPGREIIAAVKATSIHLIPHR